MSQKLFTYFCADDNGVSNIEDLPIKLQRGSIFKCEYGCYRVISYNMIEEELIIYCERVSTDSL